MTPWLTAPLTLLPTFLPGSVPLLAAGPTPRGALLLLAAAIALGYLAACVIWPHTTCPRCDGAGRHRSPSGKNWRTCRRCEGTGSRTRIGRRLAARLRRNTHR